MLSGLLFLFWLVIIMGPIAFTLWKNRANSASKLPLVRMSLWAVGGTLAMVLFLWGMGLWTKVLWWTEEVHQVTVFWTRFWIGWKLFAVTAGTTFIVLLINAIGAQATLPKVKGEQYRAWRQVIRWASVVFSAIVAIILGLVMSGNWAQVLLFLHRVPFGIVDPIFNKDVSFYVFILPMLQMTFQPLLLLVVISALLSAGVYILDTRVMSNPDTNKYPEFVGAPKQHTTDEAMDDWRRAHINNFAYQENYDWYNAQVFNGLWRHMFDFAAVLMLVFAWGMKLSIWELMYSARGTVFGPGYTDVHVQIPMNHVQIGVLIAAALGFLVVSRMPRARAGTTLAIGLGVLVVGFSMLGTGIWPSIFESQKVAGNKVAAESTFVKYSINNTRQAYGLTPDRLQVREFNGTGVPANFDATTASEYQDVFNNVRLWDWRVLATTLDQKQAFRQYYDFADVDIDRITVDGRERQVMLALREFNGERLSNNSDTKFNRRFVYTHGYGDVMVPVNEFDPTDGMPNLWVKNIPSCASIPGGYDKVEPRLYYAEKTLGRVYVNTRQPEFDYPSGDGNATTHYRGRGGVLLGQGLRKLAFALQEDGMWLLLSNQVTDSTKVMWNRDIRTRLSILAPFLYLDDDVYAVPDPVTGRTYMMADLFTHTDHYPYSEPFNNRFNYIRNSVKAVLDCYDGTTTFYVFDERDPLIRAWMGAFPTLFKPKSAMPPSLLKHIRYPEYLISVQAEVYATYHMSNPQTWINKEDVWQVARETYNSGEAASTQEVLPYFVMNRLADEKNQEFVQMLPMTPFTKEGQPKRNNMVSWLAGRCDPENYGHLYVDVFSKQQTIAGPLMIESMINQDPVASKDITLWGNPKNGSTVIQGNMLVVPVGRSVLYVEPIFLSATANPIPKIVKVAVSDGERLGWEGTFEQSLAALLGVEMSETALTSATTATGTPAASDKESLIKEAGEHWKKFAEYQKAGAYAKAGAEQEALGRVLEKLLNAKK